MSLIFELKSRTSKEQDYAETFEEIKVTLVIGKQ